MTTTIQATIASFTLTDLAISVGTTVTWTQTDGVTHTTTSGADGQFDGGGWSSPFLNQGGTFSHTFDEAGIFAYTCRIHPSMSGTVTVTNGSGDGDTYTSGDDSSGDIY